MKKPMFAFGAALSMVGAALFALSVVTGPAAAQSPIIIKFSHVVANDTPKGKGAL
jgi:C4-dicarboxylate-binding protein DctP